MARTSICDLKVIAVGDNFNWGKGDTVEEALTNAFNPRRYLLYIVHPDSTVDGMGAICSPAGRHNRPKLIQRKGIAAPKAEAAR